MLIGPSAERTRRCRYPPKEWTSSTSGFCNRDVTSGHCGSAASSRIRAGETGHQVARRALRQRAAMVHKDDAVEAHGFVHVGRADQHRRAAAQQTDQQMPEFLPGHRVNAAGRFIQQQNLGAVDQGGSQPEFFLHSAR